MFFASFSSSYAYQETLYTYGGESMTGIQVNSYVTSISLSASWNNVSSYTSSGMVRTYNYDTATFSNEYYYNGWNSRTYNNTIYFDYNNPQYFSTIYLVMSASDCIGQATLTAN